MVRAREWAPVGGRSLPGHGARPSGAAGGAPGRRTSGSAIGGGELVEWAHGKGGHAAKAAAAAEWASSCKHEQQWRGTIAAGVAGATGQQRGAGARWRTMAREGRPRSGCSYTSGSATRDGEQRGGGRDGALYGMRAKPARGAAAAVVGRRRKQLREGGRGRVRERDEGVDADDVDGRRACAGARGDVGFARWARTRR